MSADDVLVLVETNQSGEVADISVEILSAARSMVQSTGGQIVALSLGTNLAPQADALAGADRVLLIEDPGLAEYTPEPYLIVLENVVAAESPCALLVGSTSMGLDLAPALAARIGAPVVGGCKIVAVEGDHLKVTASICAGKLLADLVVTAHPAILLVLPGSYRPGQAIGSPQVETRSSPVPLDGARITFDQMVLPDSSDVDITKEETLVCVGRGIEQEGNMELAEELAEALGGQLCASRPIVDQGWLSATRQVGKSGMTVKPKCYIALGISGAPEHVEGMTDSELIIAVNSDPNAPIFEVADYGVIGDLLEVVPALTEAIKSKAGA